MRRLAFLLLLPLIGCGPTVCPPSDPDRAVEVLRTALDAWKNGEAPEALQGRRPPIWFNEPEHRADGKLVSYRLDGAPTMYGRQVRCAARLTLQTKSGKTVDRTIAYLVDTTPNCVITRDGL